MFMHNSKIIRERIQGIEKFVNETAPAMCSARDEASNAIITDEKSYMEHCRVPLNILIVEFLTGSTTNQTDKGTTLKFNKPLPNKSEISEVCVLLNRYINEIEASVLFAFNKTDDDMSIPSVRIGAEIPAIEKINGKKFANCIIGADGAFSLLALKLTTEDCINIAGMAEEVRRKRNRTRMFIVGGIVLLLTGGAITAAAIKKDKEDEAEEDVSPDVETIDENDMPAIDEEDMPVINDDDVPAVSIE